MPKPHKILQGPVDVDRFESDYKPETYDIAIRILEKEKQGKLIQIGRYVKKTSNNVDKGEWDGFKGEPLPSRQLPRIIQSLVQLKKELEKKEGWL